MSEGKRASLWLQVVTQLSLVIVLGFVCLFTRGNFDTPKRRCCFFNEASRRNRFDKIAYRRWGIPSVETFAVIDAKDIAVLKITEDFKLTLFNLLRRHKPLGVVDIPVSLSLRGHAISAVSNRNDHVANYDIGRMMRRVGKNSETVTMLMELRARTRYVRTSISVKGEMSRDAGSRIEKMEHDNWGIASRYVSKLHQFSIGNAQGYVSTLSRHEGLALLQNRAVQKASLYGSDGRVEYDSTCRNDVSPMRPFRQFVGLLLVTIALIPVSAGIRHWGWYGLFLLVAAQVLTNVGIGLLLPADLAQFTFVRFLPWPFAYNLNCLSF